ncbi:MAG: DUF4340 domain-containing protein [Burkholderiales bacterium]
MNRGWLVNLGMLGAVALLVWAAMRTPSGDETANPPLSAVKPAEVRHVVLSRPGQPALELQRQGERWMIIAPLRARADEFQVQRMLTVLEAKPAARFPANDLDRFDLRLPVALLTIDGTEYAFGAINTVTREQYVRRGDTVYAVSLRHGAALPANPVALVRRVLLNENEIPAAILLPEFSVRQSDKRWVLAPPSAQAGADELQAFVDRWRQASAARAEPHDGRPSLADVRIELRAGAPLVFSVVQREPNLVLWRQDNDLQYTFLAGAAQALLAYPGSTAPANNIK